LAPRDAGEVRRMSQDLVINLGNQALWLSVQIGAPIMGLALVVGLVVSILQATTQINEQTLAFAPKVLAILAALVFFGPWMLTLLTNFTARLLGNLGAYIR
jgi:flagellar biosynthetic protein FliQ